MPVKHFGVITETRVVDGSVEQVFDFLADFSTTQQWDPVRAPAIPPSHLPSAQPPVSVTPIPSFSSLTLPLHPPKQLYTISLAF